MKVLLEQDGWRLCWGSEGEHRGFHGYLKVTDDFGTESWRWKVRWPEDSYTALFLIPLVDRLKMLEAAQETQRLATKPALSHQDYAVDYYEEMHRVLTTNPNGKWMEEDK